MSKCSAALASVAAPPSGVRQGFGGGCDTPQGVRDGVREGPFGGPGGGGVAATPLNCGKSLDGGVATPWSATGGVASAPLSLFCRFCPLSFAIAPPPDLLQSPEPPKVHFEVGRIPFWTSQKHGRPQKLMKMSKLGGNRVRVWNGWGYGIAIFRALKLQISEPEIWRKSLFLRNFQEISASEKYFSDSGKWPFHTPPIHTPTKCRPKNSPLKCQEVGLLDI